MYFSILARLKLLHTVLQFDILRIREKKLKKITGLNERTSYTSVKTVI